MPRQHLKLSVFENRNYIGGTTPTPVWAVNAVSDHIDQDMRAILPFLITASLIYAGTNSDGPEIIRVKAADPGFAGIGRGK